MASNETPKYKLSVVEGTELKLSLNGAQGPIGPANTLSIGTVTTGETGTPAAATITGSSPTQTLNLTLPKGNTGTAATVTVGSTSTGAAGSSASVTNVGTSGAAVLNFAIPRGDKGDTGTVNVGTTTTGPAGSFAAVTNSGTSTNGIFNFTIPRGDTGATGPANVLSVASTITSAAGTNALVTISGTSPSQSLSFSIPRGNTGATGPANTLSIGTVTSGLTPAVTITGTSPNQTLNFVLQKGDKGDVGDTGPQGPTGLSSTAFPYFAKTTSTSGNPLSTFITWNQAIQVNATILNVSHIGSDTNDYDVFLALIKANDYLIIQSSSNSDVYQKFLVTGTPTITPNSYIQIPVVNDSYGGSNFANNDPVLFIIQSIGPTGPTGPANTLSIGSVTAGGIGVASATITGTSPNQTLNLVIPTGQTGATGTAATIAVGSVATGAAGSDVTITNSGTSAAAVFDFSIPKGDTGDTGPTGPIGPSIESLIITETTTARTLALTDTNQYIRCTNVSQTFITVPPESAVAWTEGAVVYFRRDSTAGAISLIAGSGVTINNGSIAPTIPVDQNFALKKVGTNIWDLI
jgi:hypothetical protein